MKTVWFEDNSVKMINQRKLPLRKEILSFNNYKEVAAAIKDMSVRGAPAIGIAAAYGVALAALENNEPSFVQEAAKVLESTRPTAVNLFYAIDKMRLLINKGAPAKLYLEQAKKIEEEDEHACRSIGKHGSSLIDEGDGVLTHCNAGGLATGGFGTAVGIIKQAVADGKNIHVYVGETRPLLQGARLTAWELAEAGINYTLITDNMAAYFMKQRKINKVVVGADRIAANGDAANKIGTYGLAILCKYHKIPFYIAAPLSTFDKSLQSGDKILIECRSEEEVKRCGSCLIAPEDSKAANPAFDVTPAILISAIITEKGMVKAPYNKNIKKITTNAGHN